MIEAGLEFDTAIDRVVKAFIDLPASLRPVHFSHEEKPASDADRLADPKQFAAFVANRKSGFFLLGPGITYSVRAATGEPLICDCFLDVAPEAAEHFLWDMSKARPTFGFACIPGDREGALRACASDCLKLGNRSDPAAELFRQFARRFESLTQQGTAH